MCDLEIGPKHSRVTSVHGWESGRITRIAFYYMRRHIRDVTPGEEFPYAAAAASAVPRASARRMESAHARMHAWQGRDTPLQLCTVM